MTRKFKEDGLIGFFGILIFLMFLMGLGLSGDSIPQPPPPCNSYSVDSSCPTPRCEWREVTDKSCQPEGVCEFIGEECMRISESDSTEGCEEIPAVEEGCYPV